MCWGRRAVRRWQLRAWQRCGAATADARPARHRVGGGRRARPRGRDWGGCPAQLDAVVGWEQPLGCGGSARPGRGGEWASAGGPLVSDCGQGLRD
eukprot:7355216-Prymnesium_polylepis.1